MSSFHLATGTLALLATATAAGAAPQDQQERPFDLMVGDAAPALQVKEWIQGEPVTSFAPGQVHVVEFWATWCGPCRKAIPHVNALQTQYGDDVRFIGVSIWESEPEKVGPFVEEMGENMQYTVGADVERSGTMARTWMEAAGEAGIPSAFVVDGQGRVAWIGHPMSIDEPLAQVVAGEWDLAAAAERHLQEKLVEKRTQQARAAVATALEAKDYEAALRAMDEAEAADPRLRGTFAMDRFVALLNLDRPEECSAWGRELVDGLFAESAGALNHLAWLIVDPDVERRHRDLDLALSAAKKACELSEWESPEVLDTYAVALFRAGRVDEAIAQQEQAVKLAAGSELEKELRERLEHFRDHAGA